MNKNNPERIKFEERGGIKMKDILGAKNPFKKSKCIQKTCPLCSASEYIQVSPEETKIPCNSNNVGYKWQCVTCQERNITKVYEGETGRSARIRGAEHLKEYEKKLDKSVLFKHKMSDHRHEEVRFKISRCTYKTG